MAVSRNRPSPDSSSDLPSRLRASLIAAGVGPGARLCVGLSGGVDSVALLHLLHRLQPELGFQLSAAYVHHGLSPRADHWQAACAEHCARLALPFAALPVAVARDHPRGLEAAARLARYAALDAQPADWLVLGHHQDDQAETLIFRLLRGTGLAGAGAMRVVERPIRGLPRLRPLLGVRRREIEAWARAEGLAWVEDESNVDPRFTRNRLRRDLLPAWEAELPGAVPALARAAGHFQEGAELLDELAALDHAACSGGPWSLAAFAVLSEPRRRNLVRWAIRRAGGQTPESARLAEALRQLGVAGPAASIRLPLGGMALCVHRGRLWLEAEEGAVPSAAPLSFGRGGGIRVIPWGRGRVVLEAALGQGLAMDRLAGADCELTPRWPGLRLRPGADRPSRSFKNLCQEAGLPAWWRERLPVLRVGGAAAWIGGIGAAAEFACPAGEPGVVLRWERDGSEDRTG
jgi:tRNA(Ile)-lysidine synthase